MISQNTPNPCLVVQWYKGNELDVCDNEFFPDSTDNSSIYKSWNSEWKSEPKQTKLAVGEMLYKP